MEEIQQFIEKGCEKLGFLYNTEFVNKLLGGEASIAVDVGDITNKILNEDCRLCLELHTNWDKTLSDSGATL